MTTTTTAPTAEDRPDLPVARVLVTGGGPLHEVRAAVVVWRRDLIRFLVDRGRIVSSMLQPLLFLFVLGKGLGATVGHQGAGAAATHIDYSTFLFPGTIATGVMFSAVFSAISIVWDREFGFLREMLVAPVSRQSIVVGKCFGGATVSLLQGIVLLALAGLVHVPYDPLLLLGAAGLIFLISFAITAFGLVLAVRTQSVQAVMPLVQMLLAPLMFLSGSLFPLNGHLPEWLRILTKINPMSYGVDALRQLVFHYLPNHGVGSGFTSRITWDGWAVPGWLDVIVVVGVGSLLLAVACAMFARGE